MSVRVRFAPSPTGPLHIGGVRTALYNYLFARKHDGTVILRIEDTDQARYVEGAEQYIIKALSWLGLNADESPVRPGGKGPYRQSERADIYTRYAGKLIDSGAAYYAFDTPGELEKMREDLKKEGVHTPKYDVTTRTRMRNSLTLPDDEVQSLLDSGTPYTIRLLVQEGHEIMFHDLIRGEISFRTDELDDKVLMKAGGLPTYHMANVVDDHLMDISHVIRGEEWLSSTAHHVMLYRAFGWADQMPEFAHLPLILKPTGKGKLSKRDGAKFGFPVFPLDWQEQDETYDGFREAGFLPEALINFLAFLGWNPGTEQEIMSHDELVEAFSLDQVTKSGARFDYDKALWFNSQYLQASENAVLAQEIRPLLAYSGASPDEKHLEDYCDIYKERSSTLQELADQVVNLIDGPEEYDEKIVKKKWDDAFPGHFEKLADQLGDHPDMTAQWTEEMVKEYISSHGLKMGDTLQLLRTAISGTPKGPDVFRMLALVGSTDCVARLRESVDIFTRIHQQANHGQEKG